MNWFWADILIRYSLGILFFFQAYDKLFVLGTTEVIRTFSKDAQQHRIPDWVTKLITYLTSGIELIAPVFLICGFCTDFAAIALCLNVLLVMFSFSWMNPMWDMKHVFPRLVLLIFYFMLPHTVAYFRLECAF